jgi:NCAIR mutase (PurE)-related protein
MWARQSQGSLEVSEDGLGEADLSHDLGFAKVDLARPQRVGMAEAIYGPGKTPEQCAGVLKALLSGPPGSPVVLTRANSEQIEACLEVDGSARVSGKGVLTATWRHKQPSGERAAIVTAGTADLPVAIECEATLVAYGIQSDLIPDCGVAGLHRLLGELPRIASASVVIVVAGMEGALASVVAGLVAAPVIGVPASTGYGSSLEGATALLSMSASCAQGLAFVGIDNGFGAACCAVRMLSGRQEMA